MINVLRSLSYDGGNPLEFAILRLQSPNAPLDLPHPHAAVAGVDDCVVCGVGEYDLLCVAGTSTSVVKAVSLGETS